MTIYDINEIKQKAIDYLETIRLQNDDDVEEVGIAAVNIVRFISELENETTKEGSANE